MIAPGMKSSRALAAVALLIASAPVAAHAPAAGAAAMRDGHVVMPPAGWLAYCGRNPSDGACRGNASGDAVAAGDVRQLRAVQRELFALPRRTDSALFEREEYWHVADARGGDCEDIALAARAKLLALGWPAAALRLATVWTEQGEYHVVLTVDIITSRGGQTLVLDSRFRDVKTFAELLRFGYRFDARQAHDGATWVAVDRAPGGAQ